MRVAILGLAVLTACSAEGGDASGSEPTGLLSGKQGVADQPGGEGPCVAPLNPSAYETCDFGPAERMRGVWVTGFEQSGFVPDATAIPAVDDPTRSRIWLAFAPGSPPDPAIRAELDKLRTIGAVAIEFVGRRSRGANADRIVMVDRIISMRILGPLGRR